MKKYLDNPNPQCPTLIRASKIDPFKADIERMLEADPTVSAMVIRQRLQERGFDGGITIVRDDLHHRSQDLHIFARHSRFNNVCYSLGCYRSQDPLIRPILTITPSRLSSPPYQTPQ